MANQRDDSISKRIQVMGERVAGLRAANLYFYNRPVTELHGGARVVVDGREMGMYASYGYLGLLGHPRIGAAARAAVEKYGTGTHGVRTLAGTLTLHGELEAMIAEFKHAQAAITYSSGYATNLSVVSTLVGRHDVVICDKLNHASIVDGCLLSGAEFWRFRHNDMADLERLLVRASDAVGKLVVVDAVFSMDGDIIDLPAVVALCRKYNAWLMVDEAHSLGVLGAQGRGIEEHFGLGDVIDIKMGTLSKTIPSVGGYIAGPKDLVDYLRHASRAYIFSAALPPAQAAAALEAFRVILDEPERIARLRENTELFLGGLRGVGFDTLQSETAIVPVICGTDERAFQMTRACQLEDIFVLPVVSPAVPEGLARLRATVTAAHEKADIEKAMDVIIRAGRTLGVLSK
jgi:8-amino-7-oxononanoate synthase